MIFLKCFGILCFVSAGWLASLLILHLSGLIEIKNSPLSVPHDVIIAFTSLAILCLFSWFGFGLFK